MLKTAAVMRCTFTSNARKDSNFKDYLRKLKSYKISNNTWDIPFAREADIEFILQEIKEDFGYPIQIFEVLESPEISTDGKRYDMYVRACLDKIKIVDKIVVERKIPNLRLASKISDLVASLEEKTSKNMDLLKVATTNLKVSRQFIITGADEVVQNKDTVSVTPEIGDIFKIKSPKTGKDMEVELEKKMSGANLGKYVVVDVNTDQKFIISEKALLQRVASSLKCEGEFNKEGIITIHIDPQSLKDLMLLLQKPEKLVENKENTIFEYAPKDSINPEILVPAETLDVPQSDSGYLRDGVESGPIETQILQHLRG